MEEMAATTPRISEASTVETKGTKLTSVVSNAASTLPSIVKSIHGPGVKYYYLSGQKKFDERFWDTRENLDFYNWQFHRNKLKSQVCNVDANVPAETKYARIFLEGVQKKKEIRNKLIDETNKQQAEWTANKTALLHSHLEPILEERRTFFKGACDYGRLKKSKTILDENVKFYSKLRKQRNALDRGGDAFFRQHLKYMHKLTRFPTLNSHWLKGQAILPNINLKTSTSDVTGTALTKMMSRENVTASVTPKPGDLSSSSPSPTSPTAPKAAVGESRRPQKTARQNNSNNSINKRTPPLPKETKKQVTLLSAWQPSRHSDKGGSSSPLVPAIVDNADNTSSNTTSNKPSNMQTPLNEPSEESENVTKNNPEIINQS